MMWTKRKSFENIVKQTWRSNCYGNEMFKLIRKTQLLKTKAKEWSKTNFGNIFKQLKDVESKLQEIQSNSTNTMNQNIENIQRNLLPKQNRLLSFHQRYWRQRSKNTHLKNMDTNSKYFHRIATGRRNRKHLKEFTTRMGVVLTSEAEIRLEVKKRIPKQIFENSNRPIYS